MTINIVCDDEPVLDKFGRRVSLCSGISRLLKKRKSVQDNVEEIYDRVRALLGMSDVHDKDLKIRVYKDKPSLHEAFFNIYYRPTNLRAWYIFEYHTIYVSADDLNAGMLAHEMAHVIVDSYFGVKPPIESSEILARYVDTHLYD